MREFPMVRADRRAGMDRGLNNPKRGLVERLSTKETLNEPWEQLTSILDAIDEKVYVADPDSYEILYANPAMKKLFGEKVLGGKCYKVMQRLDEPCEFCTNHLIFGQNLGKTHIWEFRNRKTATWVRCIDRAIKWWDGRMVRFEMTINIHSRKVAEEGLKESEEEYRQLVENIHEVIYATDSEGILTYVSPAIEPLTGYKPSEIVGRRLSDFIFSGDKERIVDRSDQALLGQQRPREYRILTKSGKYCWVRTFSKPAFQEGKPIALRGVLSDITEYKETETALRESEKRFRLLLETMNEGFRVIDEKGLITYANKTLAAMLGYKVEELIGHKASEFLDKESRKVWVRQFEKRRKQESTPYEMNFVKKDGERIPTIVSPKPNFDEKGVFKGSFSTITDIRDLKRTEKALREREKELKVKTTNLQEMNAALRVLLRRMEEDRQELEDKVRLNIQEMIQPYLERLKVAGLSERHRGHLKTMEANLNEIMSPFTQKLLTEHPRLTPAELQIANLLRQGRSSKEIADDLGLSLRTVETHRRNMRTKLGIKDKKTNLRSYLLADQNT
jgi:PAS domain S-box-containing protein